LNAELIFNKKNRQNTIALRDFCIQKCVVRREVCNMNQTAAPDTHLLYEVRDGVGRITFNRPQARNSLTFNMYERLAEICESAGNDRTLKVLILTGAGDKAFASGTDINQFRAFKNPQDAIDYEARIDRVLGTLEQCQVPTIAAINGVCAGGGAGIAACCDLRIGTRTARFGFPIARTLGNCLSASNLGRLSALIGATRLKEIIFTARLIEAEEGHSLGLLHEVVEDLPGLERRADELARLVASHAPLTLRATKQALHRMQPKPVEDEDLILMCYQSRDFREGMDAFLSKRQPQWTGD
jgi:enoyl-CoA hydratase